MKNRSKFQIPNSFYGVLWILALLGVMVGLSACHTTREVVTVRETAHDTIYRDQMRVDSIYIDRWTTTEARHDTVFRDQVRTEYRLRYVRDTTYIARRDTIPVVTYIDRPTPYVPKFVRVLAYAGGASLLLILIGIVCKARRFLSTSAWRSSSAVRLLWPTV